MITVNYYEQIQGNWIGDLEKKERVRARVSEIPPFQCVNAHSNQGKFTSFPSTLSQL